MWNLYEEWWNKVFWWVCNWSQDASLDVGPLLTGDAHKGSRFV